MMTFRSRWADFRFLVACTLTLYLAAVGAPWLLIMAGILLCLFMYVLARDD